MVRKRPARLGPARSALKVLGAPTDIQPTRILGVGRGVPGVHGGALGMDCSETKGKLVPYAAGTLASAESGPVEEHLAECEACRLELELVKAVGSNESPSAPPSGGGPEWTLDRIFGPGAQPEGDPASAPAAEIRDEDPSAATGLGADSPDGSQTDGEPAPAQGSVEESFEISGFEATAADGTASDGREALAAFESLGASSATAGPAPATPTWDFEPTDAKSPPKP